MALWATSFVCDVIYNKWRYLCVTSLHMTSFSHCSIALSLSHSPTCFIALSHLFYVIHSNMCNVQCFIVFVLVTYMYPRTISKFSPIIWPRSLTGTTEYYIIILILRNEWHTSISCIFPSESRIILPLCIGRYDWCTHNDMFLILQY